MKQIEVTWKIVGIQGDELECFTFYNSKIEWEESEELFNGVFSFETINIGSNKSCNVKVLGCTFEDCERMLRAQISDGVFENWKVKAAGIVEVKIITKFEDSTSTKIYLSVANESEEKKLLDREMRMRDALEYLEDLKDHVRMDKSRTAELDILKEVRRGLDDIFFGKGRQ